MTGAELFHALSFVDERYIAEAETAKLGRNTPWMKWVSVAACLCILITGVYAYRLLQPKGAMEAMPAETLAAAPEAAVDTAEPAAAPAATEAAPRQETAVEEEIPETGISTAAGELQQIPYAHLRILDILEEGSYVAVVEETDADTGVLEAGMEVTLVVDPAMVPGADAEVQSDLRIMHTDAQIKIENGAYDAGIGTLYVAEVVFLCRGDH